MKKKLFFIVISVLLMISLIFYMAFTSTKNNVQSFEKSGYVLNNESKGNDSKTTRYYFTESTNYKKSYDDNVVFKDTNGDSVKVNNASFVHYNDESVSVLKKSVILNLEDLNSKVPKYYNIFEGTILENVDGTYYVDNLGKKIKFKKFIVKVSDTKYLLISDSIKLHLDNETAITLSSNYCEINIVDEDVVTIENAESKYQTINNDAYIEIDENITLNLGNKYFFLDGEGKISLNHMVIDSDDNINITPLEVKDDTDEDEEDDSTNGGTGGSTDDNEFEGGAIGGAVGGGEVETEVKEAEIRLPSANIESLDVTSNKIEASIKITDEDSIVTGTMVTTIVDNATGKVVYQQENAEGNYNIDIAYEQLNPESTYSLTTKLNYTKNDTDYSMDVVQQIFITSSIGLDLEKNYFTSDSLNFYVNLEDSSKVKRFDVKLLTTTEEEINSITVEADALVERQNIPIEFTGLNPNTKYTVKVENILYDSFIVSEEYSIEQSAKTLKGRPVMPDGDDVTFKIDKKASSFQLSVNNISDPYNGIEKYTYEIYDTRTMYETKTPVYSIDKASGASVDVKVDNNVIRRGVGYVYKVIIEFYDNEKYVEYETTYSQVMQLDGVESPSITWKSEEVTFERIKGVITISDPGNTIDLDSQMLITYTNSIGITEQFTTEGNTIIPFSQKNLRANETYTISVYGSVNLQDGNGNVDLYHIGSTVVRTDPTNAFNTSFVADSDNVGSAFTVHARLMNSNTADNTLEAQTLTGITFILHEGTTVNGRAIKTVKKVDRDTREYYSDLKNVYYDSSFVLNPSFFGLTNSDLSSDYYTIEITDAYDYTRYSNNIPINNNYVTVKSNGFIPDLPEDLEDALTFETIRNKDSSTHYDENLDPTTLIGFKVKANYDNAKRYAKTISYHVWDMDTGEELTDLTQVYTVPSTAEIDYVYFYAGYGTEYETEDTTLVRGHRYYVTYVADLDLNGDGAVDTKYPAKADVYLKSQEIALPKQAPIITMYPSTTSSNTFTIKYMCQDIDKALYDKKFKAYIGPNELSETLKNEQDIVETQTYKALTFTGLTNGFLRITADRALIKREKDIKSTSFIYQYFEPMYTLPQLNYTLNEDTNRIELSFDNAGSNQTAIKRIAAMKLTFKAGSKTVVKDFVKVENNMAVVDLYDLSEMMNMDISVTAEAYYDSGVAGFDVASDYVAFQAITNEYGGGEYFTINSLGSLSENENVDGSIFSKKVSTSKITLTNKVSNRALSFDNEPTPYGYEYNHTTVNLKQLNLVTLKTGNNKFRFDKIVPGISLVADDGFYQIVPSLREVTFLANIYGFGISNIKDSLIYVDLYETDEVGSSLTKVSTSTFKYGDFGKNLKITNLNPKTNYAMRFFAYIDQDGTGNYQYQQLFDLDDNTTNKTYYFKTLSGVSFSEITHEYVSTGYENKNIRFTYKMNRVVGFDKIKYRLYQCQPNGDGTCNYKPIEITIPESRVFEANMILDVPCPPGSDFIFGGNYKLEIIPVAMVTVDGETTEVELDHPGGNYEFALNKLRNPYVGIRSNISTDSVYANTLEFKVNLYDRDHVVVGNTYTVKFFDQTGKNITPTQYKNQKYNVGSYNRTFTLSKLTPGEAYTIKIYYTKDIQNNITSAEDVVYSYVATMVNANDVNVGIITPVANSIFPNRVNLQFMGSYRLTAIDTLRYSIYNSGDGTSFDGSIKFNPTPKTIDNNTTIYIQELPTNLPVAGLYYIQLQFLDENVVAYEGTVDYTYIVGN